jgi:hypothetical protein
MKTSSAALSSSLDRDHLARGSGYTFSLLLLVVLVFIESDGRRQSIGLVVIYVEVGRGRFEDGRYTVVISHVARPI